MTTIYADVLFLINFSADYLSLYLTMKIMRDGTPRWRLLVASILGAVYSLPALLLIRQGWILIVSTLLALVVLVRISFRYSGMRRFVRATLTALLISLLLGGAVTVLYRIVNRLISNAEIKADTGGKLILFLLLAGVSYILIRLANRLSGIGKAGTVTASITVCGRHRTLFLLSDTACFLREPLSGKPVIVLSCKGAEGLLPVSVLKAEAGEIPFLTGEEKRRYYAVPYHTVSGKRLMHGFRPDKVEIYVRGHRRVISALLGVGEREIANYQGCDGIIPAALTEC